MEVLAGAVFEVFNVIMNQSEKSRLVLMVWQN